MKDEEIPGFVFASNEERAAWRSLPMTTAFFAYLEWQFNRVADGVLAAVRLDRATEAKILLGHLDAIQSMRWSVDGTPAGATTGDAEALFIDPAAVWRHTK